MQPQFLTPAGLDARYELKPGTTADRIAHRRWHLLPPVTVEGDGPKARKRFAMKNVLRWEEAHELGGVA